MLTFQIQGSGKNTYTVTADGSGNGLVMSCTCPAGRFSEKPCKHRTALLLGDITNVIVGVNQIVELSDSASGSIHLQNALNRPTPRSKQQLPDGVSCLESLSKASLPELKERGYIIEFRQENLDWRVEKFLVFERFKNGKQRKNPSFSITWEEKTGEHVYQFDGSIMVEDLRPRIRPYTVRGRKNKHLHTRAKIEDAYDDLVTVALG